MLQLFALLALFQVKHFLCDYPLQTPYMLGKFKGGTAWVAPLLAHAGVHAAGTFAISFWFVQWGAILPAALDFAMHFTVDRVKAAPEWGGRWKPDSRYFWWALGVDQGAHHLTHYAIIFLLISA